MELSKLYRRNWLMVALAVWLGLLVLYIVALPFVALGAGLFVIEAVHHLSLLSPFLAWEVARDVVRKATVEAPGGGWMLSRPLPRWPLWVGFSYAALTLAACWLDGVIRHGGVTLEFLLAARVIINVYWLVRCIRSASDVAVLELAKTEDGKSGLQLEDFEGPRRVTIEEIDAATGEVRVSHGGAASVWMAIGSMDTVARRHKPNR